MKFGLIRRMTCGSLLLLLLFAASASGEVRGRVAALGPPPVPCGGSCSGGVSGTRVSLPESPDVHITVAPHYVHPGQTLKMKITFSGPDGHCLPLVGSDCGPIITSDQLWGRGSASDTLFGLVPVDCGHPARRVSYAGYIGGDTTQCYRVLPSAVTLLPGYTIVSAVLGPSSVQNGVSEDWFAVLNDQFVVSGRVTEQGSGGAPAPGVRVRAECSGGGTTTTDAAGNYSFALAARSVCTIAPRVTAGTESIPKKRVVDVVDHDIHDVDFKVGCSGSGRAPDVAGAAAAIDKCKLYVKITGASSASGLKFLSEGQGSVDNGPVFIRRGAPIEPGSLIGAGADTCVSGCTDLTVTVKGANKHGQLAAVSDATLKASVTPIKTAPYPSGGSSTGFLCTTTRPERCGTFLDGLKTDSDGKLILIYWAPGVIDVQRPKVTVKAEETCSPGVCPVKHRTGEFTDDRLKVSPNVIVNRAGMTVTPEEANLLVDWVTQSTSVVQRKFGDFLLEHYGIGQVKDWLAEVVLGLEADPVIGLITGAAQAAYDGYSEGKQVEHEFTTLFLGKQAGFGVPEVGLGDTSTNWCWGCHNTDPLVQDPFLQPFAKAGPVGPGALYKYALALEGVANKHPSLEGQEAQLSIEEVSYCEMADEPGDGCGPGVFDSLVPPGCNGTPPDNATGLRGIHAYLYFDFRAFNNKGDHVSGPTAFVVPYNPFEWMSEFYCPGGPGAR